MNRDAVQSTPEISVIVPAYNIPTEMLTKCIDSILCQNVENIEVIIIVDGPCRENIITCEAYLKADDRVKLIQHENRGVSVCRNEGMEAAKGKWVAFVDADDWLEPNYLGTLLSIAETNNVDIALCDCFVNYAKAEVVNRFFDDDWVDSFETGKDRFFMQILCPKALGDCHGATNSGAPWGKLYRKEFLAQNEILFQPKLRRMQDNIFNLYAYENAKRIVYSHKLLYHYRKSTASGFTRYNPQIGDIYELVFEEIDRFIATTNKGEMYKQGLYSKVIFSFYVLMRIDFANRDNPFPYAQRREMVRNVLNSSRYTTALEGRNGAYLTRLEKIFAFAMQKKWVDALFAMYRGKELLWQIQGKGIG